MRKLSRGHFLAIVSLNLGCWCVLGLQQQSTGQTYPPKLPFANSVEQRLETINELREIKNLLKEQNELLSGGKLQVNVVGRPR